MYLYGYRLLWATSPGNGEKCVAVPFTGTNSDSVQTFIFKTQSFPSVQSDEMRIVAWVNQPTAIGARLMHGGDLFLEVMCTTMH